MIVVDTGVLLAVADADDGWHTASTTLLTSYPSDQLILPAPVIPETGWMIAAVLGPATEAAFIASVAAGDFTVTDLTPNDWHRVAELVEQYGDMNLGTVDAAVIAIAERLNVTTLATINPRDFRVVRPAHCDAFELVPTR
jgi:predicted nucleic acid-binding protein